jgi:G3E family GTPase
MDLLIISGFLGSGKTTLLLDVARCISAAGLKIAIIENEVGAIGVDDQLLMENGLNVREIFSGCICCSLRIDLITTLLELEREHAPDVVILEPSGVAGPKQVIQSLYGYGGDIQSKTVLSIVDASRFQRIRDYSIPLIADGITIADAVVLNKIDLVNALQIDDLKSRIQQIRGDVVIIETCAKTGNNFEQIAQLVLSKLSTRQTVESQTFIANAQLTDMPQAVVIAIEKQVSRPSAFSIEEGLTAMVQHIAAVAKQNGCSLIGHIKSIAKNNGGYLFASVTDFDSPVQTKGRLAAEANEIKLTVNAIVYGVDKPVMEQIVAQSLERFDG